MSVRYRVAHGLRWLDFGDESVAFDPLSWDAHVLNASAAAVLELLQEPRCIEDIAAFLSEALVESERGRAAAHARQLLDDLVGLGLVRELDEAVVAGG